MYMDSLITDFCLQVELIRSKLIAKDGTDMLRDLHKKRLFHATHVGVYSVDGYQGQEADVVIITTVRVITYKSKSSKSCSRCKSYNQ
jgi:superfamily I DNA and/or RNA helicase